MYQFAFFYDGRKLIITINTEGYPKGTDFETKAREELAFYLFGNSNLYFQVPAAHSQIEATHGVIWDIDLEN